MPSHPPSLEPAILPAEELERKREIFRKFLTRNGFRHTNQRVAIFDAVFRQRENFTAEQLLEFARRIDRSVSRSTVYRSLPILVESGMVKEIDVGKDYKLYLPKTGVKTEQAQVVCLDCDKIFHIDAPFMEWYGQTVSQKLGLEPVQQRLQVHARCRKKDKCPNWPG